MEQKRLMALAQAYIEAIAESDFGIPNGHLYALVAMAAGYSLDEHNGVVHVIKTCGLVVENANLLSWNPDQEAKRQILLAAIAKQRPTAKAATTTEG